MERWKKARVGRPHKTQYIWVILVTGGTHTRSAERPGATKTPGFIREHERGEMLKANVKIICDLCGREIFGKVHIQHVNRLTHNDYGLYSVEYENKVALIIHDNIEHVYSLSGMVVCKNCYDNNK